MISKKNWDKKVKIAKKKYKDWNKVVGNLVPNTCWSAATMSARNGTDIAYFLGKNMSYAKKIVKSKPVNQMLAINYLNEFFCIINKKNV